MEWRPYQIFLVITCVFFLIKLIRKYIVVRVNLIETVLGLGFWGFILLLALFPDRIGGSLSHYLGFESDINAIIFVIIGMMMFVIFKLYNRIRVQDKNITSLTRRLSLVEYEMKNDEDTIRS